jgi:predicted HicB family RNase H-like nuclease
VYERGVVLFEVKKPEMANKTFRMPKKLLDKLSDLAQKKGVSLNNLIVQCCEYALENLSEIEQRKEK